MLNGGGLSFLKYTIVPESLEWNYGVGGLVRLMAVREKDGLRNLFYSRVGDRNSNLIYNAWLSTQVP